MVHTMFRCDDDVYATMDVMCLGVALKNLIDGVFIAMGFLEAENGDLVEELGDNTKFGFGFGLVDACKCSGVPGGKFELFVGLVKWRRAIKETKGG